MTNKTGMVLYKCHRATCDLKGAVMGKHVVSPQTSTPPRHQRRYKGDLQPLTQLMWKEYFYQYGISRESLSGQGIMYATDIDRYRIPVVDHRGYEIGENLKAARANQKPKSLLHKFNDVPFLHFPLGQEFHDTLVLVEDQISSIKVSRVHYCAALLGTNLSDDGLKLLKEIGVTKLQLMLDGDKPGIDAALRIKEKAGNLFLTEVVIVPDGKDPKDLTFKEIEACLGV